MIVPASRRRLVLAAVPAACALLMLSACGSSSDDDDQPMACAELAGMTVPAARIGLPTSGATVTSATVEAAGGTAPKTFGEYCKVMAEIAPVDPAAPKILMQLNLPATWNGKALMLGGGGYNGTIPNVAGNVPAGPADRPNPIGLGYAVFASDSGHQAATDPANPGVFALNQEALRNFSFEALKKTRDAAMYLIDKRYGDGPRRSYFAGGSTGGREALAVTQKWPADFDGAIVLYPAYAAASLDLQFGRITRALAQPGAYPNLAKRQALFDSAVAACDGLDGVADGVISHQAACNASYDPATATLNGQPLRCPGGADTGDSCLSDAQITAMKVIDTPIVFGYPVASGETSYPGFNTWGTDFGRPGTGVQQTVTYLGLNTLQPTTPMPPYLPTGGVPYHSGFWSQWAKYFVTRDPGFDALTLDPQNPGPWQARISELTGLQDINQADLSAFESRGGKILMAHGTSDQLVSTRATQAYYARVQAAMGAARTAGFLRYYEIPGYGHAASTVFNAAWDSLTALDNWVEQGIAPPAQTVADTVGVPGRTRPLCDWPAYPRYRGSGDVNAAASFVCTAP
ncbi:tannase/feruloyl esterase family alpha/beta hydrolase [Aquincola sp. J276]|uniref:tannase/feruloyl esterase family alpha/beta hydrolase n=1 Tax=Aquincola sp. J276 TaxID=2898432 RepID=UPI002151DE81|nr:tannase/feruloyl esterase family alpha/beta hydrolase [Aquincola sp. J276]MCR5863757.1 tannase/feruloyl esterase family alpha/beta hydrolase [Aquincola sp. J276]